LVSDRLGARSSFGWSAVAFVLGFLSLCHGSAVVSKRLEFRFCKLDDRIRTLEVFEEKDYFFLVYTKGRGREEAARGTHHTFVKGVMDNIQGNLEKAGWKCETLAPEKVSEKFVGS
jgi:hypothetical protein